jgi:4-hydroxy-tetrahydrodipicolinate synthase
MTEARFVTAIGTPLAEDDSLHEPGLELHLADQWDAGIHGILVAGTMGIMQLLREQTYCRLIEQSAGQSAGRGEVFVGAGDTSLGRTLDRIRFLNRFDIAGVVVLPPYFLTFGQEELLGYYTALADAAQMPVFMYDHPGLTRTKLTLDTVLKLSEHPNIGGIKVSDEPGYTRQLRDAARRDFRVIFAAPDLVDYLLRNGVRDHLDGIYSVAPQWTMAIARHAAEGDWEQAARYQRDLSHLRRLLLNHGAFAAFTVMMNARGIPGNFAPPPCRPIAARDREAILADAVLRKLVKEHSVELASR